MFTKNSSISWFYDTCLCYYNVAWQSHMLICRVAELMLLGFISLLLTATSRTISNICIDSKFYNSNFSPCTRAEVDDTISTEDGPPKDHKLVGIVHLSFRRTLSEMHSVTCSEACVLILDRLLLVVICCIPGAWLHCLLISFFLIEIIWIMFFISWTLHDSQGREPFVSYEGLEQLHKFIFVMAITHVAYSCLTMLLAIVKVSA